tara:strand:+ start:2133 stop:2354 length:222 start_codon:yes stop_codon:yes gene_type:complete
MVWRLVYKNDGRVISLNETNGKTYTIHNIFDGLNQEECFNKIDELKLNYQGLSGGTEFLVLFSGGTRTIIQEE